MSSASPKLIFLDPRPTWTSLNGLGPSSPGDLAPESESAQSLNARPTLLLVDEDDRFRRVIAFRFRRSGLATKATKDVAAARWVLSRGNVSVVIVSLSVAGGAELVAELRSDLRMDDTAIVAVLKKGGDAEIEAAFRCGVDDLVQYPFAPAELVRKTLALLRPTMRLVTRPELLQSA